METAFTAENMEQLGPEDLLDAVFKTNTGARSCLTCSFQAEDILVLHLLRRWIPQVPVLFLETGYHFKETYEFRNRIAQEWSLNLVNVLPQKTVAQQEAESGTLYRSDPTACCQLRKVRPLLTALEPYEIWFTGLRREQSPTRKNLKKVEQTCLPCGKTLLKVSPLADWTWAQVWKHTADNQLSYLPQYDQGYLSIGCQPCTAIPGDATNPRSGRWGGKKLECGIHTFSEQSDG
jgi:phosphoadenosine phosphosulfate reductase